MFIAIRILDNILRKKVLTIAYPYYPNQMFPNYNPQSYGQQNIYTYVDGISGAKNYPVQPNATVLLMDNDKPVFYQKSANNVGQTTIKYFVFKEVKEEDLTRTAPTISVEDYQNLLKRVENIETKIGANTTNESTKE